MKILGTFIIFILSICFISNTSIGIGVGSGSFGKNKLSHMSSSNNQLSHMSNSNNKLSHMSNSKMLLEKKKKKKHVKLLPGKLYFQGWVRFYKYTGAAMLKPNHFFKNPQYLQQKVTKNMLKKKRFPWLY